LLKFKNSEVFILKTQNLLKFIKKEFNINFNFLFAHQKPHQVEKKI